MTAPSLFEKDEPVVVEVVRGGVVESVHAFDVAVVDSSGVLVARAGDPGRVAYFRSSLKPIQAAISIEHGWEPPGAEELAVACASHNGEPAHLAAVRSILAAAGLDESSLRCPVSLPLREAEAVRAGEPQRILHNCSGKHAAFLAACVKSEWPLEPYLDAGHPIQLAVIERVRELAGELLVTGVDGCGALTAAVPLHRIAHAFGSGIRRSARVGNAMRAHPFLIAGTGRLCTDVMGDAANDLILKGGAEGLQCAVSPSSGLAAALKARDGSARAVGPATIWALRAAGMLGDELPASIRVHAEPPVLGGGRTQGSLRIRA